MPVTVRAHQNDTVDALCWRHYGRTAGITEDVLQANPGLADYGPTLPQGLAITMPDAQTTAPQRQMVNLWD
jgi:phage tail protein X